MVVKVSPPVSSIWPIISVLVIPRWPPISAPVVPVRSSVAPVSVAVSVSAPSSVAVLVAIIEASSGTVEELRGTIETRRSIERWSVPFEGRVEWTSSVERRARAVERWARAVKRRSWAVERRSVHSIKRHPSERWPLEARAAFEHGRAAVEGRSRAVEWRPVEWGTHAVEAGAEGTRAGAVHPGTCHRWPRRSSHSQFSIHGRRRSIMPGRQSVNKWQSLFVSRVLSLLCKVLSFVLPRRLPIGHLPQSLL